MCGCQWDFVCSRCRGTWQDPLYELDEPVTDAERAAMWAAEDLRITLKEKRA